MYKKPGCCHTAISRYEQMAVRGVRGTFMQALTSIGRTANTHGEVAPAPTRCRWRAKTSGLGREPRDAGVLACSERDSRATQVRVHPTQTSCAHPPSAGIEIAHHSTLPTARFWGDRPKQTFPIESNRRPSTHQPVTFAG